MFGECERVLTNAQNTAARVQRFNGVTARALYHPPPIADRLRSGEYGDYRLLVSRLEPLKRVELAIRAMAHVAAPARLVIVGDGSQREALEREATQAGATDRITFAGACWGDAVADLYARALGVIYAPFDEDYGYVTIEAFLAARPVITATDSGGPLEFVRDGVNGFICEPDAMALAAAINTLARDRSLAERLGRAGRSVAQAITWDGVIELIIDADGQHAPEDAQRIAARLGDFDLVIGARATATQATSARRAGNALLNNLASYLTSRPIPDLTSGFRGARTEYLREFMHLLPNGFSTPTTTTLAFIKAGHNVAFEPVNARQRSGHSKIRFAHDGARFLLILLKIVTLFSPLRIFLPISVLSFVTGSIYGIWNMMTNGKIPNGAVILILFAVIVFLVGLVSEQIASLRFEGPRK